MAFTFHSSGTAAYLSLQYPFQRFQADWQVLVEGKLSQLPV